MGTAFRRHMAGFFTNAFSLSLLPSKTRTSLAAASDGLLTYQCTQCSGCLSVSFSLSPPLSRYIWGAMSSIFLLIPRSLIVSFCLSVQLFTCLCIAVSACLGLSFSVSACFCLCLSFSIVSVCFCPSLSSSVCFYLCHSLSLTTRDG